MSTNLRPKRLMKDYLPGTEGEFEVGLSGVGVHVILATLGVNSAMTDAQLIAAPPNTNTAANAVGPVVHSLGTAPTAVIAQAQGSVKVSFNFMTADNSAVYVRPFSHETAQQGPVAVAARIIVIR